MENKSVYAEEEHIDLLKSHEEKSYLNSEIQKSENSEQLLDYMVDENQENKNKYLKFIIDKMKIKKVLLEKEYFNIIDKPTLCENIKEALNNYTMNENEANVILDNCS